MGKLSLPPRRRTPSKAGERNKGSKYPSRVVGAIFDNLLNSSGSARNPRTVSHESADYYF